MNTPKTRGRKPDAASKSGQIRKLLDSGMTAGDIAKQVGCTPALVYNVKARMGGKAKRGPGRPPKSAAKATARTSGPASLDAGIAGILAAVKGAEQQRAQLRGVLERIRAIVADVLA